MLQSDFTKANNVKMPKPPPVEEEEPQAPRSEAEEIQMNINRVTDEVF